MNARVRKSFSSDHDDDLTENMDTVTSVDDNVVEDIATVSTSNGGYCVVEEVLENIFTSVFENASEIQGVELSGFKRKKI